MENFRQTIAGVLEGVIGEAAGKGTLGRKEIEGLIEVPPSKEMGDFAFPCFKLAPKLKKDPKSIAQELAGKINEKIKKTNQKGSGGKQKIPARFERVEQAGAYVNFFVGGGELARDAVGEILREGENYGRGKGKKETAIVEYCQANTHKAFHIGHVRNISIGESVCRLLEFCGFRVVRANYEGDVGPHVSKTLWGLMELHKGKEPEENKGLWLGKVYAEASKKVQGNAELEQKMRDMVRELYGGKNKKLAMVWKKTRKWSLDEFARIYREFGVKFDRLYFESEVERQAKKVAEELLAGGIAEESEGAVIIDLKKYSLGVFIILKQDGMPLYSAKDLALVKLKAKEYEFQRSYHVVGAEQDFYFRQLIKTFELMGLPQAEKTRHISYALVMLEEGKMASREGNVITYDELLGKVLKKCEREVEKRHKNWARGRVGKAAKAIALSAIKFGMLSRENSKVIVFNWERAAELEGETGPYVQYSYARGRSILRKAGKEEDGGTRGKGAKGKGQTKKAKVDYSLLKEPLEKELVSALSEFTQIVGHSAEQCSPHILAQYLLKVASAFNSFYQKVPVLKAGKGLAEARLGLVLATTIVLKSGLNLLGIEALEEM